MLLGRRRKLVPTGGERLIWAMGDGSTLQAVDMPLARYAMYAQGPQIYCALTWDRGEPWLSSMRHIAREGGFYLISAGMPLHREQIPVRFEFKEFLSSGQDEGWINGRLAFGTVFNPPPNTDFSLETVPVFWLIFVV